MSDWLSALRISVPEEGREVAVKLARIEIKLIQRDSLVRDRQRPGPAGDADALSAVSQTVATQFATVAAASNDWRGGS
ncbi:MAG: hexameric tyrosine-coordinated heme protein [Gammaproteobacteria bacterium]